MPANNLPKNIVANEGIEEKMVQIHISENEDESPNHTPKMVLEEMRESLDRFRYYFYDLWYPQVLSDVKDQKTFETHLASTEAKLWEVDDHIDAIASALGIESSVNENYVLDTSSLLEDRSWLLYVREIWQRFRGQKLEVN